MDEASREPSSGRRGGGRGGRGGGSGGGGGGRRRGGGPRGYDDSETQGAAHDAGSATQQDAAVRVLLKRGDGQAQGTTPAVAAAQPQLPARAVGGGSGARHDVAAEAPDYNAADARGGRRGGGRGGRGSHSERGRRADGTGGVDAPLHAGNQAPAQQQHTASARGERGDQGAVGEEERGGGPKQGRRGGASGGGRGGRRDDAGRPAVDPAESARRNEEDEKKAREDAERKAREDAERKAREEAERIAREETERKAKEEAERIARAEAERRAKEEAERREQEEKEALAREEAMRTLRAANAAAWTAGGRPDEAFFRNLDSSLKRNTAVVKKLKTLTGEQADAVCNELRAVNLTKYVSEAVGAVAEAKFKLTDVLGAVKVCSLLHQRYAEFTSPLYAALQKQLNIKEALKDEDRAARILRLRVLLRLAGELIAVGVFTETAIVAAPIRELCMGDKDHAFAGVFVAFCKHCGEDVLGLSPPAGAAPRPEGRPAREPAMSADARANVKGALVTYCEGLCAHVLKDHKDLREREKRNSSIIQTKGELSEEMRDRYEKQLKAFDKILASANALAELLGLPPPDLPKDESATRIEATSSIEIFTPAPRGEGADFDGSLWEDEEQRAFYEDIPDLRAFVPAVLFGPTAPAAPAAAETPVDAKDGKEKEKEKEKEGAADGEAAEAALAAAMKDLMVDDDSGDEGKGSAATRDAEAKQRAAASAAEVDALLQRLPSCMNRKEVDELATAFCYNNSKGARKRLIRALFATPRNRTDLLPFYARLTGVLRPCIPEIGDSLATMLLGEFGRDQAKKDQTNVDDKLRVVRYLGELTKFGVLPKQEALNVLKRLLDSFTHHNIDCACVLLETCGRFLFRSPDSHVRTRNLLDVMMRKRNVQHMDNRHSGMIESAYFHCNPPERQKKAKKTRPPLVAYVRHLLFERLNPDTTEDVLRALRRLPWNCKWQSYAKPAQQAPTTPAQNGDGAAHPASPAVAAAEPVVAAPASQASDGAGAANKEDASIEAVRYAVRCLCRPWKVKFGNIQCLASVASGLSRYIEDVQVVVVDATLEDIRLGLEVNIPKWNQRRVSVVRYFGELYNYKLCESTVVFETLYRILFFGHNMTETGKPLYSPPADAADDYFRVRLVCSLLDTCGQFFATGSSAKKLDCFLAYFQRYCLSKAQPLPIDIEFALSDMYEIVRPRTRRLATYEDAAAAVAAIEKDLLEKAGVSQEKAGGDDESESGGSEDEEDEGSDATESSEPSAAPKASEGAGVTSDEDGSDVSEGDSDEGSDEGEDDGGSEEEEEAGVRVRRRQDAEKKGVDEDFLAEYNRMMQESLEQRRAEVRVPALDVAVPMHLRGAARKTVEEPDDGAPKVAVKFTLLTKKGNKQQLRELEVPADSTFASAAISQQRAAQDEKNEMKRLVLQYEEQTEQDDDGAGGSGFASERGGGGGASRGGGRGGRMNQKNRRLLQTAQINEFFEATQSQQVYFGQQAQQAPAHSALRGRGDGRRR